MSKIKSEPMISLVLPTYNEKDNIVKLIQEIESLLTKEKIRFEIVVVDDNSPDGTADVARKLNQKYRNIRVFVREKKLGIGSAHMFGYNKIKGDIVIAMDTDLSHDPRQMLLMIKKVNEGYDMVVGSRHMKGAYYEKKTPETMKKFVASRLGNIITTLISRVPIHDFTNGYRAIKKEVIDNVKTNSTGNSFLMEFIVKAHRKGYRITEVPVTFMDRKFGKSKLKLGEESMKYFKDLFKYSFE